MSSLHSLPRSHASVNNHAHGVESSERPRSQNDSPPHVSRKRRSDLVRLEETKRRRYGSGYVATEELLEPSIVVRAHPPNPLAKPCTLLPIMLLPREHLPLSMLDLASPHGNLPFGRQFQSDIRILELEGRLGSNLLLARAPSGNSAFAIEGDSTGLYSICKLGSWVDLQQLSCFATAICQERMPRTRSNATAAVESASQKPALITAQAHKEQRRRRLAIEELQSIVRRRPALQLTAGLISPEAEAKEMQTETPGNKPEQPEQPEHLANLAQLAQLPTPPEVNIPSAELDQAEPPTAGTIFQNIRNQYFEALYHSMGSLAYFAKGPLSRARAAFHLDCDSNLEMEDLISFLKSMVLATALIDKKYRETIPELVARVRLLGSDALGEHDGPKRTAKKAKKIKRGSNGLYTDENKRVGHWWLARQPEVRSADADDDAIPRPEEVKYAIASLRTRETQLQIILILEILALETMRPAGEESQLPGVESANGAESPKATRKKRSKHNLPLLIDVHADRLCIWQTTASDDVRALTESQPRGSGGESSAQAQADPLRDFCVDIIVPFFSARLPLVCDSLNRKLGGPVISPPSRHSAKKKATTISRSLSASRHVPRPRPGSATRRPAPTSSSSSAHSLERVLSNERLRRSVSRGPNDAIAHLRSATAAPIPGLKRETSEPMLGNIPRRGSSVSSLSTTESLRERPANVLARSVSDVGGGANDLRAHKKALVDAELQQAISALKKPNREMAGRAAVEAAERRLFGGAKRNGSGGSLGASPTAAGKNRERVLVKATPVNNRFRDVYAESHQDQNDHLAPLPAIHHVMVTPSRIQATPTPLRLSVPDSAKASTTVALAAKTSKAAVNIGATPQRPNFLLASSPLQARPPPPMMTGGGMGGNLLFETPTKPRPALPVTPLVPAARTVYEQLGWDDEDDLA